MLAVSRSPLRISFFGGGTDYPEYYQRLPGAVVGTAINKYVYTAALPMAGFAENRYRVTYRQTDAVDDIADIKHNVVRAVLQDMNYRDPINIAIFSDIPGNSGLGSSSSFTVGFIKLIEHLRGRRITALDLMRASVRVEKELLAENVGIQDQTHAAFGGLNKYNFHGDDFSIRPIRMHTDCRDALNDSLVLVYTGSQRHASVAVDAQINRTRAKKIDAELGSLVALCEESVTILEGDHPDQMLRDLGQLLNDGWRVKRSLSDKVSSAQIDEIFEVGVSLGAYGGKLCGAGNGGFFLFLAAPEAQKKIAARFGRENIVKISIEDEGAKILTP